MKDAYLDKNLNGLYHRPLYQDENESTADDQLESQSFDDEDFESCNSTLISTDLAPQNASQHPHYKYYLQFVSRP